MLGTWESQKSGLGAFGAARQVSWPPDRFLGRLGSGRDAGPLKEAGKLDPHFPKALKQLSQPLLGVRQGTSKG